MSEICVFYLRRFEVTGPDGPMTVQKWMRHEWQRAGLTLYRANEACEVVNAATRKYLTQDWLWYWLAPGEMTERLAPRLPTRTSTTTSRKSLRSVSRTLWQAGRRKLKTRLRKASVKPGPHVAAPTIFT